PGSGRSGCEGWNRARIASTGCSTLTCERREGALDCRRRTVRRPRSFLAGIPVLSGRRALPRPVPASKEPLSPPNGERPPGGAADRRAAARVPPPLVSRIEFRAAICDPRPGLAHEGDGDELGKVCGTLRCVGALAGAPLFSCAE